MSAKHGWTLSGRALGFCLVLVLVGTALFASVASAAKTPLTPTNYIALGDSISYGYSEQKFEENYPSEPASAFETGFVNLLGKKLAGQEKKAGNALTTANLSCPGEVSDGLIGENPMLGGGQEANGKSDSAPCAWHNVDGFPRHFEYGMVSQLEAAAGIVTGSVGGGALGATKYVTLQIGSNDELAVVAACKNEAYLAAHGFKNTGLAGLKECLEKEVTEEGTYYEKGAFYHIIHNLGDVVGVLRAEGYKGVVAILGFYNPQAEILPGSDELQKALNAHVEEAINGKAFGEGVVYANPFSKINPAKSKSEAKAICKYTEECNTHDKHANFVKYLEGKGLSHSEAEAYATEQESKGYVFPEGDIHPTEKGHKLFAKLLYEALTTGKNSGGNE